MPLKGMKCLEYSKTPPPPNSPTPPESSLNVDLIIETASLIIEKWNPEASTFAKITSLFHDSKREAFQLIKSVHNLQKSMFLLIKDDPASDKLVRAQKLMQIAMARLQKEFHQILSFNRAYLDPESVSTRSSTSSFDDADESRDDRIGDSIAEVEEASSAVMADLKAIADCMIANGYAKECVSIYRTFRKSIIDEAIFRLGVEKITSSQANKMDWEVVDLKVTNWLNAFKTAVKTLFHGEKILSDQVFASSAPIRESTFAHISRDGAATLFTFPEVVAKIKKKSPPEKIFRLLEMYATVSENWQEIESIFSSESTTSIRLQAINSLVQLSEFIAPALREFKHSIRKDSSKAFPLGGGVHSLTVNAMNYISALSGYSFILTEILPPTDILSPPAPAKSQFHNTLLDDSSAPAFSRQLAFLIFVLLCKLEEKAKQYRDAAVSYLFLANNLQHVISKVCSSNLRYLLGNDWVSEHESKVKQFAGNYERLAWGKVVASLPEISKITATTMTPVATNEAVRKFCSSFEEAYRKQRTCIVPDSRLRDEMKVSIARKIVPAYSELCDLQKKLMTEKTDSLRVSDVRLSPEDVGNYLSDLFFGTFVSSGSSSPSSRSSTNQRPWLRSPIRF